MKHTLSPPPAKALADGSLLTFGEDGSPLARTMNGDQLWAELAADGALSRVHEDGTVERLPADPDVVVGGVRGRDALLARQQCEAAVRVHARKMAAVVLVRRMPASRPAARRAGAKRTSARAGPSSDDDPHEPGPPPRRPSAPSPRFSAPWRAADDALTRALDSLGARP